MSDAPQSNGAFLQEKFTTIAHRKHLFCSPMNEEKAASMLHFLRLQEGDGVVDIGCGKGELLIRIIEGSGAIGVGIDRSAAFLAEARQRARSVTPTGRVTFLQQDAATYVPKAMTFTLGVCIGGGGGFGFFPAVLERMSALVQPNGVLLIGECYWKKEPSAEYLEFLGMYRDSYYSHEGNLHLASQRDLAPIWQAQSTLQEWDDYEGLYQRSVQDYVSAHPEDPDGPAMLDRVERWNRMYQAHGRDTLGFGFYLLKKKGNRLI